MLCPYLQARYVHFLQQHDWRGSRRSAVPVENDLKWKQCLLEAKSDDLLCKGPIGQYFRRMAPLAM